MPEPKPTEKADLITIEEFNRLYGHENENEEKVSDSFESFKEYTPISEEDGKTVEYESQKYEEPKPEEQPVIKFVKAPVIKYHNHKTSSSSGISRGYEDNLEVCVFFY